MSNSFNKKNIQIDMEKALETKHLGGHSNLIQTKFLWKIMKIIMEQTTGINNKKDAKYKGHSPLMSYA